MKLSEESNKIFDLYVDGYVPQYYIEVLNGMLRRHDGTCGCCCVEKNCTLEQLNEIIEEYTIYLSGLIKLRDAIKNT